MTRTSRTRDAIPHAGRARRARRPVAAIVLVALACAAAAAVVPSPATAQSGEVVALRDRIARLEQDLANLRRMVTSGSTLPEQGGEATNLGGEVPPTLAAQMQVRMSQMEEEMRTITGRIEELSFRVQQLNSRMDTALSDIEYRLTKLEGGNPGTPPPSASGDGGQSGSSWSSSSGQGSASGPSTAGTQGGGPTPVTPNGGGQGEQGGGTQTASVVLPEGTASEQYDYAKSLLRQQKYAEAADALRQFIDAHPDGALTGNAYYWLGEAYYVRGDYEQAIVHFGEGYKKFPEHPKGPDNLLKLGMSLGATGRKPQACAAFTELGRKYPDAGANLEAIARKERQELGC